MLSKLKLPIIIAVVAAIAAGGAVMFADTLGLAGPKKPEAKVAPPAIDFAQPFVVNLADGDRSAFIKLGLAVELEPMTEANLLVFEAGGAGGGGHGGGDTPTGMDLVGKDPSLRDAVLRTVSRFTSTELMTPAGKEKLAEAIQVEFDHVAKRYSGGHGKAKDTENAHGGPHKPPYHVSHVLFTEYAVQY